MNTRVQSTIHGAISIVNAIATGYGSALGISLKVTVELELQKGRGILFQPELGINLLENIIDKILPNKIRRNNLISVKVNSQIPVGMGLKSSSAVSSATALACTGLTGDNLDERIILNSAVRASLDSGVSVTGAYDDSTACYFGGFVVANNYGCELIHREEAPCDLYVVVFLPGDKRRGNIHNLYTFSDLFMDAFNLAKTRQYWKAMKLNGLLTTFALSGNYEPILTSMQRGALAASISGNGPSIAAVTYKEHIEEIRQIFAKYNGITLVSKVNNEKASVKVIVG
ncbi:MAG TPA: shikimate kinase [Nitrososphaeraceae archaeon]|nr:shikimate kinase [Nitrososphaeraceae archaeon]